MVDSVFSAAVPMDPMDKDEYGPKLSAIIATTVVLNLKWKVD